MMQISGIFGIEATEWTMRTVNLQKIWSECVYLKRSLNYVNT